MNPNAPSDDNKDKKDDKREETDKNKVEIPSLIWRIVPDNKSDIDSESESKEERENNVQTLTETMKMISSFLSGQNGIFIDNNETDNDQILKKPMKMTHCFLSRLKGIFTDNNEINDAEEDDDNPINPNINPTNRQTK